MAYEFFYWPEIQGRGEFVRLLLEDAGADYIVPLPRIRASMAGTPRPSLSKPRATSSHIPFAPPRILEANPAGADHLVGSSVTYADLSLFQLIEGLRFAFPLASERELAKLPRVTALHEAVAERPRLKAYLASERRVPFKETGIFRRYSELDG